MDNLPDRKNINNYPRKSMSENIKLFIFFSLGMFFTLFVIWVGYMIWFSS